MDFKEFANQEAQKPKTRVRGSCRFSAYYKAQWFDDRTLAWKDLPKRFPTTAEALAQFTLSKEWRLMEVTMTGRRVLL